MDHSIHPDNTNALRPPTPAPSPGPRERLVLAPFSYPGGGGPSIHSHNVLYLLSDDSSSCLSDQPTVQHLVTQFVHLPSSARHALLTTLLPHLTTAELMLVSDLLSPRLKRDFLQDLPLELSLHILSFVDSPRTLARASQVSKMWRRLLEDEWTWKEMCDRHRFARLELASSPSTASLAFDAEVGLPEEEDIDVGMKAVEMNDFGVDNSRGIRYPDAPRASNIVSPTQFSTPSVPMPAGFPLQPTSSTQLHPRASSSSASLHPRPAVRPPRSHTSPTIHSNPLPSSTPPSFEPVPSVGPSSSFLPYNFLGYSSSSSPSQGSQPLAPIPPDPSPSSSRPAASSPSNSFVSNLTSSISSHSLSAKRSVLSRLSSRSAHGLGISTSASDPNLAVGEEDERVGRLDVLGNYTSSPLGTNADLDQPTGGKGKGREPSVALGEGQKEKEEKFSYKKYFKEAYLTGSFSSFSLSLPYQRRLISLLSFQTLSESNWLRGGRILSTHTSTDDGVVTSLAVDETHIVIGMANSKIHVFDSESGAFLRSLKGHEQGVWALTLVSQGGTRRESPTGPTVDEFDLENDDKYRRRKGGWTAGLKAEDRFTRSRSYDESGPSFPSMVGTLGSSGRMFSHPYLHNTLLGSANPSGSSTSLPPQWGDAVQSNPAASSTYPGSGPASAGEKIRAGPKAKYEASGSSQGWGQDSAVLVTGGCDRAVRVWDLETGLVVFLFVFLTLTKTDVGLGIHTVNANMSCPATHPP